MRQRRVFSPYRKKTPMKFSFIGRNLEGGVEHDSGTNGEDEPEPKEGDESGKELADPGNNCLGLNFDVLNV